MDFPSELKKSVLLQSLKQGTIFRQKGDYPFQSDKYHIFVVLNYDPQTGDILLLVNGTSKVEKNIDYLNKIGVDTDATTVIIEPGRYSFTPKETFFNCNSVKSFNIKNFSFEDDNTLFLKEDLTPEDIQRIINATLASHSVSPDQKRLIDPNYS